MSDGRFVSWDRWEAEHRALADRVSGLELQAHEQRGAEVEHRALDDRISAVEREVEAWHQRAAASRLERRTRSWQIALAVITGLVLPLLTIGAVALIHFVSKS